MSRRKLCGLCGAHSWLITIVTVPNPVNLPKGAFICVNCFKRTNRDLQLEAEREKMIIRPTQH